MPISECCLQKCFENVSIERQEEGHHSFWACGDYNVQNAMLSGMMTQKIPTTENNSEKKIVFWEYTFHSLSGNIKVCKNFLCKCLQIDKLRLETIREKRKKNEILSDKRGKHNNHFVTLTDEIQQLIQQHCRTIPHSQSHYQREKSKLHYFDNSGLDLNELYKLFLDYYSSVTGVLQPPISKETYSNYFNFHVDFTFSKPRTDVCDVCYEHQNSGISDPDFLRHLKNKNDYFLMKKEMMSAETVLLCEFDYGQNLPLPKLPVSDQFYKRLIWLNIFNIHVFNDNNERSYMFLSIEGYFKKGGNTTSNFLLYVIEKEFALSYYNKIYLFSDSCGGQDKNYMLFTFLILLSIYLQVEIVHLYPVRGHSYCQCDRNFGCYGSKKKRTEKIETPEEYIDMIKNSRSTPFTMVDKLEKKVKDFESFLTNKVKIPPEIKISKAVKIQYFPNGFVNICEAYDQDPLSFSIELSTTFDEMKNQSVPTVPIEISPEKIADVTSLLQYLSPEAKTFYTDFFEKMKVKPKILRGTKNTKKSKKSNETDKPKANKKTKIPKKQHVNKKSKVGNETKKSSKSKKFNKIVETKKNESKRILRKRKITKE